MSIVKSWLEQYGVFMKAQSLVEKKVTKVLEAVCATFGTKLDYWYIEGAAEGELGDLAGAIDGDWLGGLVINLKKSVDDMAIIDKNEEELDLNYGFPSRWIDEDLEDVKEELTKGRKILKDKLDQENSAKEAKNKTKKAEKEKAKTEALKKLTPKEKRPSDYEKTLEMSPL